MINKFISLVVFILLFLLTACSHKEANVLLPELIHAESIMYTNPDSALMVLEEMKMPKRSDRLNHATWCMLLAQAKYKNFIKQPSDSLINIAYDYFMERDDAERKALVLYLEAVINEELGEVEKAIQFYLEAGDEVEKCADYQLGHLIYAGLGDVYNSRNLYNYALDSFQKAFKYAELSKNHRYIKNSIVLLARLYYDQDDLDESLKYYQQALAISNEQGCERSSVKTMLEMAGIYRQRGDYQTAIKFAQKEFELKDENDPDYHQSLITMGNIYTSMNNYDSAYYYLTKALSSQSLAIKKIAYGSLVVLKREERKFEEAFNYVEQHKLYSDSLQKIDRSKAIVEIQEKYDKEKVINEKNQLKIERDRVLHIGLVALLLLIGIIAVVVYRYQRRLLQKERTIQKNEEQMRMYMYKIHENETQISLNEDRIQELTEEIEQSVEVQEKLEKQEKAIWDIRNQNEVLRAENNKLQDSLYHYTSTLQEKSKELDSIKQLTEENLRLQDRERFLSDQLLKRTKILQDLKSSPKYLDCVQWEEIKDSINWLYGDFTKRLMKEIPSLTDKDLQVSCLIKLRLPISNMVTILAVSSTSVSKQKFRLKEHILQGSNIIFDENKTLDVWLWEY